VAHGPPVETYVEGGLVFDCSLVDSRATGFSAMLLRPDGKHTMPSLTRVDFRAARPIGPGAFEPVATEVTPAERAISRGEVPSTTALDNQLRLPAPTRPGTWAGMARSAFVDTALAIALVTMIPLAVVTGMTAVLWIVGTLVSLVRGA
jgi:hypothetical protein